MLYKTNFPTTLTSETNETVDGALDLLAFFLFVFHYKISGPIIDALYPFTPFAWLANWRNKKAQYNAELKMAQVRLEERTKINAVISVIIPTWSAISNCVETPNGIFLPKGEKGFLFREKIFCAGLSELMQINHNEDAPSIKVVNPYFKSALRILEHIASSPTEFNRYKEMAQAMFQKLYSEILPLDNYKNHKETLAIMAKLSPHLMERVQK